jgi:hypothetical protein
MIKFQLLDYLKIGVYRIRNFKNISNFWEFLKQTWMLLILVLFGVLVFSSIEVQKLDFYK